MSFYCEDCEERGEAAERDAERFKARLAEAEAQLRAADGLLTLAKFYALQFAAKEHTAKNLCDNIDAFLAPDNTEVKS